MEVKRSGLIASLMLVMFLAAIEGTIVTLATPVIVRDLQGFEHISLVFSVYLLTSAISTPIYGKLADLYGRKKILSLGILIFLVGSFLCGLSYSMVMLIICRAVQGLGAGAIITVSYTIIGDVFTWEERSKIQGALSTVWGIAALAGPFVGGFLIDMLSWHWIFFINIPFGLLAVFLLHRSLDEITAAEKQPIDYVGAFTLSVAMLALLSIFLFNQERETGGYVLTMLLSALTVLCLAAFYRVEKKAQEPVMPFSIFTKSSVLVNLISFLVFAVLMGADVYLALYLQNVQGYRPLVAGLALLPMSISWLIAAFLLGKLLVKFGGKMVTSVSLMLLLVCTFLLTTLHPASPLPVVLLYIFLIGFAFGGASTALTIIIQDSVGYGQRGAAMGVNSLLRTLGQTIGISIFGSIFNSSITDYLIKQGISGVNASNLYQSAVSAKQIVLAINSSMHVLFIAFAVISALALAVAVLMPKVTGPEYKE